MEKSDKDDLISVHNLHKEIWVGGKSAPDVKVNDMSFTVKQGEILTLLGS